MIQRPGKSEKSLRWLRGSGVDITAELESMEAEVETEANQEIISKINGLIQSIVHLFLNRIQKVCIYLKGRKIK